MSGRGKIMGSGVTERTDGARLAGLDPDLDALMARVGPCGLGEGNGMTPYQALVRAIIGQQLHGKAAAAILARVQALAEGAVPVPERMLELSDEALRGCGVSAAKLLAMRGVARAALDGVVPDPAEAAALSDEDLIVRLTTLRGIGRWTVQMLLIFTLARRDVMPVDDFGVRAGWRRLKGLDALPSPKRLAQATEGFAPHRSALAWYLWRAAEEGRTDATALTGSAS
ncbi:DNA-3-methyladenine glycosylase family protein [Acidomonas methanolica]|uniref:DNA-3-methyladenine glycosylase family protein n=1 Tax=Acidomonas methanolica TaxID=437 RepID=UPI002119C988|nr:DNA-3-methyladenine glycosylase 2 family protein [Acidomonas methanolica]